MLPNCQQGFLCEYDGRGSFNCVALCDTSSCLNGGVCNESLSIDSVHCDCPRGGFFSGPLCELGKYCKSK